MDNIQHHVSETHFVVTKLETQKRKLSQKKLLIIGCGLLIFVLGLIGVGYLVRGDILIDDLSPKPSGSGKSVSTKLNTDPWRDNMECSGQKQIDTSSWKVYTNIDYGIKFLYPPDWKLSSDSRFFINNDLINVNFYTTDGIFFKGGGGTHQRGASFIVMKPEKLTYDQSIQSWVENRIIQVVENAEGYSVEAKSLRLENEPAVGLYFKNNMSNHIYARHGDNIYGVAYLGREDYIDDENTDYHPYVCTILESFEFTP